MRERLSTVSETKHYAKYQARNNRGALAEINIEVTPSLMAKTGFQVGDIIKPLPHATDTAFGNVLVVGASGGERFITLWGIKEENDFAEAIDKLDTRVPGTTFASSYELIARGGSSGAAPSAPRTSMRDFLSGRKAAEVATEKKLPPTPSPESWSQVVPLKKAEVKENNKKAVTAIEQGQDAVLILNTKVAINQNPAHPEFIPPPSAFDHFSHDAPTLGTLEKCATAAQLRLPCLLEGETAASKTSSIEYLASLTKNPIFRLNLNGQTDTAELIGKFVPNEGNLAVAFSDLLRNVERLKPESKSIVQEANKNGRGLSKLESQQIAHAEGLTISDWRWQDGIIPHAMKTGGWVILDEINLAEPQVLERLNPVLEVPPAITISEHDGEKIGEGGQQPVHEGFRIFATMNPAEYSGRAPMSPAYKDRWQAYRFCPTPGKDEYSHMFSVLIYGTQPAVEVDGALYKGKDTTAKYPELAKIANLEEFLGRLAQFHAKVAELARTRQIGKDFKEPYIFTRRGLLALIAFLNNKRLVDRSNDDKEMTTLTDPKTLILRGLKDFYLDKMRNDADKKKLEDQLASLGLAVTNWSIDLQSTKSTSSIWSRLGRQT